MHDRIRKILFASWAAICLPGVLLTGFGAPIFLALFMVGVFGYLGVEKLVDRPHGNRP